MWQVPTLKHLAASVLHQAGVVAESLGQAGYPEVIGAFVAEARAASPRRAQRHKRQQAARERRVLKVKAAQLLPWDTAAGAREAYQLERERAGQGLRLQHRGCGQRATAMALARHRGFHAAAPEPPFAPLSAPESVEEMEEVIEQVEMDEEMKAEAESWLAGVLA